MAFQCFHFQKHIIMTNVLEILQGKMGDDFLEQLTDQIGASNKQQTEAAVSGITTMLLAGLNKNAQNESGANSLLSAIDRDHDGSILDDVAGFVLGNRQTENANMLNGLGIIRHVLGSRQSEVASTLGNATGLSKSQIVSLMITLAPVVLGALGKAKSQQNLNAGGLADLLSGTVRSQVNQKQEYGLLNRLLDADGDGSILDDIAGLGAKFLLSRKG